MKAFRKSLAAFLLLIPVLLLGSEFQVKIIQSEDDLPEKFCSIWKAGDFLLSDGETLAIIGGVKRYLKTSTNYPAADALGSIIGFAPAGKKLKSDMIVGAPVIRIKDKKEEVFYSSVKPVKQDTPDGSLTVEATASYSGKKGSKARVQTLYRFSPGEAKIDVTSSLTNTGKNALEELDYSVYFSAFHSYSFSPFNREMHPELRFRVYQKKGHYLAWLNRNPLEEEAEHIPGTLEPGQVYTTRHTLLVDTDHEELLQKIYQIFGVKPEDATLNFKDLNGKMTEVIVRDAFSSAVFFRSFLEDPFSLSLVLPEGTYWVRANFFPAVLEKLLAVKPGEENICILEDAPLGIVKVKIQDSQGQHVPGKVAFIGLAPTETPYFEPDNPVETGRNWETSKNSVFPEERVLEVKLPVGTYLAYASRGPEYSLDKKVIEVLKDEPLELIFRIDRVVKTPGLISIDPHMHTRESDGRMGIAERLRSVVAEGVDVAVASDHNTITDYSPALKKLGLNKYLAVITGNEITVSGMIHYNTYQVKYRPEEEENGAISPLADEVSPLFEASRQKDQEAILQVNHPRAGTLGYFNNYQLDLESAAFAWENFNISFDVLEVMNGPYFYSSNFTAIEDWLHLLNRGYYYPLVGSSDSHGIDRGEPGYSRTYVYYRGEETDSLDWNSLAHSLRKGRTFATNGPIIEFTVNTTYTSGDTFTDKDGKVDVAIKVQSAPWIAVDEVRLIVNGERRIIFPVNTPKETILKFDMASFGLPLLKVDSYIAVEVLGNESLYPVLQRSSWSGLSTNATLPYALTNPVFVDVDGNGKFDPPLPEKINLIPETELSKEIISR
ncbi:MAG: CehA/McbA family metallohydrolase [Candidatus Aminicenantes bacterium]|nr:CehA/McbA family metallohydrolase [Candidatus Aminicenantes bacterium]